MSIKSLLQEVYKEKDLHFCLIGKAKVILTYTNIDDFLDEVKTFLDEYCYGEKFLWLGVPQQTA